MVCSKAQARGCTLNGIVSAERFIPRGTVVEISPVLLFEKDEYENHGAITKGCITLHILIS